MYREFRFEATKLTIPSAPRNLEDRILISGGLSIFNYLRPFHPPSTTLLLHPAPPPPRCSLGFPRALCAGGAHVPCATPFRPHFAGSRLPPTNARAQGRPAHFAVPGRISGAARSHQVSQAAELHARRAPLNGEGKAPPPRRAVPPRTRSKPRPAGASRRPRPVPRAAQGPDHASPAREDTPSERTPC